MNNNSPFIRPEDYADAFGFEVQEVSRGGRNCIGVACPYTGMAGDCVNCVKHVSVYDEVGGEVGYCSDVFFPAAQLAAVLHTA